MPSPFPGMDPFIESQEWPDFHHSFMVVLKEVLAGLLPSRYVARVDVREYFEREPPAEDAPMPASKSNTPSACAMPVECLVPVPEHCREVYVLVRELPSKELVTAIELLSPANKRTGGEGQAEYSRRRAEILASSAHLVELDLLRGGKRATLRGRVPAGDYYAVISRADRRPRVDVYAWSLRDALPKIPIPLRRRDCDLQIDLQEVLAAVYDRAGYAASLDYQAALHPPLCEYDDAWVRHDVLRR